MNHAPKPQPEFFATPGTGNGHVSEWALPELLEDEIVRAFRVTAIIA